MYSKYSLNFELWFIHLIFNLLLSGMRHLSDRLVIKYFRSDEYSHEKDLYEKLIPFDPLSVVTFNRLL